MMTATAQQAAAWYAQMLMPLENDIKLSIISHLSASLLDDAGAKKEASLFFGRGSAVKADGISLGDEDMTVEERINALKALSGKGGRCFPVDATAYIRSLRDNDRV